MLLSACGKPSGISNEEYAKYKEFGAPKILYSCSIETSGTSYDSLAACDAITNSDEKMSCFKKALDTKNKVIEDVGYLAGVGAGATYNKLLEDAKSGCEGKFIILDK